jgi:hypothetical protein
MYSPTNGVKEGTIANFTALVGVFLSDVPSRIPATFASGRARTGSTRTTFRERGPQSLLEGMPKIGDAMPRPHQFLARPAMPPLFTIN